MLAINFNLRMLSYEHIVTCVTSDQAARDASDEQRAEDAARLLALAEAEVAAEEAQIVDEADTRGAANSLEAVHAVADIQLHLL